MRTVMFIVNEVFTPERRRRGIYAGAAARAPDVETPQFAEGGLVRNTRFDG